MAINETPKTKLMYCKNLSKEEINARLITQEQAADLEDLFKALGNETRLRILHALSISGELCVNDLVSTLDMKLQAVSNQLQKLAGFRVVTSRRNGVNIFYRISDPCIESLLERGICTLESTSESD